MKSLLRGVAVGLAVALSAQAAQAQMGVSLGLGGGAVVPTGTFGDGLGTGWSAMVVARVKPALSPVGLQLDGFYDRFSLDGGIDGHSRIIGTTADAVFAMPGALVKPYLLGGIGIYNGKTTVSGTSSPSDSKFGLNAGAGLDFGLGGASVFAEARMHAILKGTVDPNTLDEKTAYMMPLSVGLRWSLR